MKTVIAAQAGYITIFFQDGKAYVGDPIIAWLIETDEGEDHVYNPLPITLCGTISNCNAVQYPDGKVNWLEETFNSLFEVQEKLRNE